MNNESNEQNNLLFYSKQLTKEEQKNKKEKEEILRLRHRLKKLLKEKELDIYNDINCCSERTINTGIFANLKGKCNAKNILKHLKMVMRKEHEPKSLKVFFRKWMFNVPKLKNKYIPKTKVLKKDPNIIIRTAIFQYSIKNNENKENKIYKTRTNNKNRLHFYSNENEIKKIVMQKKIRASENKEKKTNLKIFVSVHKTRNIKPRINLKTQSDESSFTNNYKYNNTVCSYNKYDYDTISNDTNNNDKKTVSFIDLNLKNNDNNENETNKNNLQLDSSIEFMKGKEINTEINKLPNCFRGKIKKNAWTIRRETYESKEIF